MSGQHNVSARRDQILSAEQLAQWTKRSDWHGISKLFQHVFALVLFGTLAFYPGLDLPIAIRLIAGLGYSIVLIFLFCPLHESIHGSAFATPQLNKFVSKLCGLILLLPPKFFNNFHMAHHRYTQIEDKDPELASKKPASVLQYILYLSGLLYWRAQIICLASYAMGKTDWFVPASRRKPVINEARIFVAIYVSMICLSLYFQSMMLFWFWILPAIVGQPFLRLFLLAEHTDCPRVSNMFENTRTTFTNGIVRWLCWDMNFHTAHHAYAGIPFHQLRNASEFLLTHIRHVNNGYIEVHQQIVRKIVS